MNGHRVARVLKVLLFAVLAAAVLGAVVMLLWNWLLPALFGWPSITFWQALALLALSRILFGRIGGRGGSGPWRHRLRDRWNRMTPEQRERFVEGLKRTGPAGRALSQEEGTGTNPETALMRPIVSTWRRADAFR